jgi:hypothetical protein
LFCWLKTLTDFPMFGPYQWFKAGSISPSDVRMAALLAPGSPPPPVIGKNWPARSETVTTATNQSPHTQDHLLKFPRKSHTRRDRM